MIDQVILVSGISRERQSISVPDSGSVEAKQILQDQNSGTTLVRSKQPLGLPHLFSG